MFFEEPMARIYMIVFFQLILVELYLWWFKYESAAVPARQLRSASVVDQSESDLRGLPVNGDTLGHVSAEFKNDSSFGSDILTCTAQSVGNEM